jgi:hypothetical protein
MQFVLVISSHHLPSREVTYFLVIVKSEKSLKAESKMCIGERKGRYFGKVFCCKDYWISKEGEGKKEPIMENFSVPGVNAINILRKHFSYISKLSTKCARKMLMKLTPGGKTSIGPFAKLIVQ